MKLTVNKTTVVKGVNNTSATVLAATKNARGKRIVTWELVYPRYIHAELMTHRCFSRNAASSRAVPIERMVREVIEAPVFFEEVGLDKPGMSSDGEVRPGVRDGFRMGWKELGRNVALMVERWSKEYGIHKQVLNRALEPWVRIRTIVTTTETKNFFDLRLDKAAQPEMQVLARCMKESLEHAEKEGIYSNKYHIPYKECFKEEVPECLFVRSVAACARVSGLRQDGKPTTLEDDLKLFKRLYEKGHLSPFEHVCFDNGSAVSANLKGWKSLRHKPAVTMKEIMKVAQREVDKDKPYYV